MCYDVISHVAKDQFFCSPLRTVTFVYVVLSNLFILDSDHCQAMCDQITLNLQCYNTYQNKLNIEYHQNLQKYAIFSSIKHLYKLIVGLRSRC